MLVERTRLRHFCRSIFSRMNFHEPYLLGLGRLGRLVDHNCVKQVGDALSVFRQRQNEPFKLDRAPVEIYPRPAITGHVRFSSVFDTPIDAPEHQLVFASCKKLALIASLELKRFSVRVQHPRLG